MISTCLCPKQQDSHALSDVLLLKTLIQRVHCYGNGSVIELYHESFRFGTEVFTSISGGTLCILMVNRRLEWFQNHLLSIVQVSEIDCMGLSSRIRYGSFILISGSCGLLKIERFSVTSFFKVQLSILRVMLWKLLTFLQQLLLK